MPTADIRRMAASTVAKLTELGDFRNPMNVLTVRIDRRRCGGCNSARGKSSGFLGERMGIVT
jgi:hypothetical protein